jgi:hypothetical protein
MHRAHCEQYGGIHEFSPETIMNVAKIHVCERQGLDPRRIRLFREMEALTPIRRWAEKGFRGNLVQSFDSMKSFQENKIKEGERFWLLDDPSGYAVCPICMQIQKPRFGLGFDCLPMIFHCKDCDWHWEVTVYESGIIDVKDETVHVVLHTSFGTIHRDVPSNMIVGQVIELILRQHRGIRGDEKGRIVQPEDLKVFDEEKELRQDLSLAEQRIYYSVSLQTKQK